MTKPREPGSFEHAAFRIIGELTPPLAAETVKRSEGHIARWTDPDHADSHPNLEQALALDIAYVKARPEVGGAEGAPLLSVYLRRLRAALAGLPQPAPMDLRSRVLHVMAEAGDIPRSVNAAFADGHISAADAREICEQAVQLVDQLQVMVVELNRDRGSQGGGGMQ